MVGQRVLNEETHRRSSRPETDGQEGGGQGELTEGNEWVRTSLCRNIVPVLNLNSRHGMQPTD